MLLKVPHELSRRRFLGGGIALSALATHRAFAQVDEFGDAALRGAGSTLVQPLMEAWVRQYRADPHQVIRRNASGGGLDDSISTDNLDYEPVGSLAGIQRIRAGFVDFAASEMPLRGDYLRTHGLVQFPWVIGGVAVVFNVSGTRALRLDATTLAAIYLGKITRWSDPAIARQNPGTALKDEPIITIYRSDGSGSTFTFSHYLSRNDAAWKQRLGSDLTLKWPGGRGINGSGEMVAAVRATPNSLGYVSVSQARSARLATVSLRNADGHYTQPDSVNIAAAVASTPVQGDEFERLPIDARGEQSYPLVATVFGFMRQPLRSARQRRAAEFVRWTLTRGNALAHELGYVSLPENLAKASIKLFAAA
jgi:phosphate transport system substrate-binding protein